MLLRLTHKLWQFIPRSVRRNRLPAAVSALAKRYVASRKPQPGPLVVAGLLRSTVGLAQGARLCIGALRELGFDVYSADLSRKLYWHHNFDQGMGEESLPGEGGQIIIHLNPPELPLGIVLLGRSLIRSRRIIGYWAWELPTIPEDWKRGFDFVDEIWVPSTFVAEAIRLHTTLPVHVVHHPVRRPVPAALHRSDFGLPNDRCVCLMMFDMRSCAARKNPVGAIRAFRAAFGNSRRVMLVVKIGNPSEAPDVMVEIERETEGACNIKLIFDKLPPCDQAALLRCADILISLHRAEGFGLALAEGMWLGKAVVATGWSGNMEFMNSSNSALVGYKLVPIDDPQQIYTCVDQCWADPKVDEAANWLRRLESDEGLRRDLGTKALQDAENFFSQESFARAIHMTMRDESTVDGFLTQQRR